jgi:DNA-binding NarL/FixJ family response regulator
MLELGGQKLDLVMDADPFVRRRFRIDSQPGASDQPEAAGSLHAQAAQGPHQIDDASAPVGTLSRSTTDVAVWVAALPLTPAERVVLQLFGEVLSDKAVALSTGKRLQTVRNQLASILRKLQLASREELLFFYFTGRKPPPA